MKLWFIIRKIMKNSDGVLENRPWMTEFLEQVGMYYELIAFTEDKQKYGDLIIDIIDAKKIYFEHRFYRQHTVLIGNYFKKDISRIGRPMDKIIIVDDVPQNIISQKENEINIKPFWGDNFSDCILKELSNILIKIANDGEEDVRISIEKYKDEIISKVTSNFSNRHE